MKTFGFLFCLLLSHSAQASPYQWRNVPVGGGGFVSGLLFHPKEKGLLYARTDVGGAYRWDASAKRWIPLNDSADRTIAGIDETGVLSMAIDPKDPARLYLTSGIYTQAWWPGKASLLISADQGRNFKKVGLPFQLGGNVDGRGCGERLLVDPALSTQLYLGTNKDGLWRSEDQGLSWSRLPGFSPGACTFVFADVKSKKKSLGSQRLLAGVADPAVGLLESRDGGKSWKPVKDWPQGQMALRWAQAGRRLLMTASDSIGPNDAHKGGIYAYDLDKNALKRLPAPEGMGAFSGISVEAQDPDVIVISTLNRWNPKDEVFRSVDGGKHWRPILDGATIDPMGFPYVKNHTPHWIADIKIDPFDQDRALFVTGFGLFASRNLTQADAGKPVTWAFEDQGLEETVPLRLASPPWGAPLHSAMGDQNGFTHWSLEAASSRSPGEPPWGSCPSLATSWAAEGVVARVGWFEKNQKGTLSLDGGKSWAYFADQAGAKDPGKICVSTDGKVLVWCPGQADCLRSTDQGASWQPVQGLPKNVEPQADSVDPALFYGLDLPQGKLYVSHDAALSFSALPQAFPPNSDWGHGDVRPVPGKKGEVWVSLDPGLWVSKDSGLTFSQVANITEAGRLGFGAPAPGAQVPSAYIVGKVGGVYGFFRSDDQAASWTRVNDDQHQFGYINAILGDSRVYGRAYVATGGRGILVGE